MYHVYCVFTTLTSVALFSAPMSCLCSLCLCFGPPVFVLLLRAKYMVDVLALIRVAF